MKPIKSSINANKNPLYYYMYGKHTVFAALNNKNRIIEKVLCTQTVFNDNESIIRNFNFEVTTNEHLFKIFNQEQNHQGIVAKVKTIFLNNLNLIDLNKPNLKIVILDQITDSNNVGSIIRSAAAFNIDILILPQDNSPIENEGMSKAASGMLEFIKIIKVVNLRSTMEFLKQQGFWIIGLDGEAKENINSHILKGKIALVLGSENKGMRRLTKENCDHIVKIPMSEKTESLNVAHAAAIAFHLTFTS